MLNPELFVAFLLITFVLIVTPGPVVTLVIATGATEGPRAALVTVLGTTVGNGLLVGAIAFGLTWLLKSSVVVFEVIRWIGAAYLVWLGIQAWRHAGQAADAPPPVGHVHFWRGFLVALSNPKTIAFFTAFLPQFVDPRLPAEVQLAVMCAVSVLMAAVLDSIWGIAAGLGRAWFMKPARARLLRRLSGTVLIGGGVWLSLARRPA
ncbi:MAG TPA: LysE family translocator [Beijerinckiaceae bacterium]|jgi:threonine/homoserine/homoserine lactone efflux protein